MRETTTNMTTGAPHRLILRFALPLIVGLIFQHVYHMADTVIVGRVLGMEALAGVGATGPVSMLVIGFCNGCCAGFSISVAQSFGAGEKQALRDYVAGGVWVSAGFAALLTVATVALCKPILRLMQTPEDCFAQAHAYIAVIFAGIPFTFLYNLLSGWMRSLGDSRTPLVFLVLSSVLNVALDLLFILPLGMGVSGAALATVLSQGISGALCLLWVKLRVPALCLSRGEWRFRPDRAKRLCMDGVPMGLQCSITGIGSIVLQTAVNSLGTVAVAAITAGTKVFNILGCPSGAVGTTMAIFSAQNVGAKQYKRLSEGVRISILMGFCYGAATFAFAGLFGSGLVSLFTDGKGDAQLIEMARRFLLISAFSLPIMNVLNVLRNTIQGMGFSMLAIMSGVMELAARVIAAILLVPRLRYTGACLGTPLAWLLAAALLLPTYCSCKKQLRHRG